MIKLTINRETILKPVQLVAGVVGRQPTIPILSHILLIAHDTALSFIGADSEVELCALTDLEKPLAKPIKLTLPGKKFLDICRSLPENSMIGITEHNNQVIVSSGKSRFVLATLPAKNFPISPEQTDAIEFKINQEVLRNLIEKTSFSIPQQDVRQYLNGLLLELKNNIIQSLATDAHRLALNKITSKSLQNAIAQVIVPKKGVFELLRLLNKSDEEVSISVNANFVRITGSDFVLTSKLISGKFPNYSKIIPKKGNKKIVINRDELKQALTRVGILSNELFRSVRLQLRSNLLTLTSNNPDQEEATEELTIDYKDENLDTIFNIGYLIDILNTIAAEQVVLSFKDNDSGIVIEGVDSDKSCFYAVMPIRTQ